MTKSKPTKRPRTRWAFWAGVVLFGLVAAPPVIESFSSGEPRNLRGVDLTETTFSEVNFTNFDNDLELAGMLFRPKGAGPFPAAIIIQGSGTSRRDNGWYLTLADHLQQQGIAVLLPDKRGSEGSEGDWRTASFEDLATDTHAAIAYLEAQDLVPVRSIGVIGMSQGGRIAPIVASQDPSVSWVVNVVGDAVTAHDSLRYEESHNLREMGFLPGVSDLVAYPSTWSLIHLRDSDFWDAVGDFDPIPYWKRVDQPVLTVYGEQDTNVPTEASAKRLNRLDKPNIRVRVYEGSGHAIEDPVGEGNSIFRVDALEDLSQFVLKNA